MCGYPFGDQHLNEVIVQGLEGNPTAAAFGLMRGEMARKRNAATLAGRRSNLSVLAKDAAVIGTITNAWGRSSSLDLPPNTTAVTWTAAPTGASAGAHGATVSLGDFAVFGRFLAELIGHEPVPGLAGAPR